MRLLSLLNILYFFFIGNPILVSNIGLPLLLTFFPKLLHIAKLYNLENKINFIDTFLRSFAYFCLSISSSSVRVLGKVRNTIIYYSLNIEEAAKEDIKVLLEC